MGNLCQSSSVGNVTLWLRYVYGIPPELFQSSVARLCFSRHFSEKIAINFPPRVGCTFRSNVPRTGHHEREGGIKVGREGTCKDIVNHKCARASGTVLDETTRAAPKKRPDPRVGRVGKIDLCDESSRDESEG